MFAMKQTRIFGRGGGKMMRKIFAGSIAVLLMLISAVAVAEEVKTIVVKHEYILGDNDSKNDAKKICFHEARRMIAERAGSYIKTSKAVESLELSEEEIALYACAFVETAVTKTEWTCSGESLAVTIEAQARVDRSRAEKQLFDLKNDDSLRDQIKKNHAELRELNEKLQGIQKKIGSVNQMEALVLRNERNEALAGIDKIEIRYEHVKKALDDRKTRFVELARNILKYVEVNMTPAEVEYIVGKPDSKDFYPEKEKRVRWFTFDRMEIEFSDDDENLVDRIYCYPRKNDDDRIVNEKLLIKFRDYDILKDGILDSFPYDRSKYSKWLNQFILGKE
jgi:hypothetical protein